MIHEILPVGVLRCNCSIFGDETSREAIVIDPGDDIEEILAILAKHQLLILNCSRRRAPNLRVLDRLIAGFCSLWIQPRRLARVAIAFRPSTLLNFHRALVQPSRPSLPSLGGFVRSARFGSAQTPPV